MPSTANTHIVIGCEDEAMRDGLRALQKLLPSLTAEPPAALRIKLEEALAGIVHAVMDSRIPELQPSAQPLELPAVPQGIQSEDCLAVATWFGGDRHGEHAGQILLNATEKHIEDVRTHTTLEVRCGQSIGLAHGRINPDGATVDWYAFMASSDMSTDNAAAWVGIAAQLLAPDAEISMLQELNQRLEAAQDQS